MEILNIEIKNNSVFLNGEELSHEEVEHYLKSGIKYDGLKEFYSKMGVTV